MHVRFPTVHLQLKYLELLIVFQWFIEIILAFIIFFFTANNFLIINSFIFFIRHFQYLIYLFIN